MTATSNPMIDITPKPPAVLMRDGKWIVGPEQRPKGWEKLPIKDEFREAVAEATVKQSLTVQPEPPAKPETKWGELIATVLALGPKEDIELDVPEGVERSVFTRNFRAMLSSHREAGHIKWGLYAVYGQKNKIRASKSGYWPSYKQHLAKASAKTADNISPDCEAPEPGGHAPCALKELPPEAPVETAGAEPPNQISDEKKAALQEAFEGGASIREAAATVGVAKATAQKFKDASEIVQPPCACGKPAGHRGWCKPRLERSTRRQDTLKKLHESQRAAVVPEPESKPVVDTFTPEPQQQVAVDTSGFAPAVVVEKAEVEIPIISYLQEDPPCVREFVEKSLRYWNDYGVAASLTDAEFEATGDELNALAHEIEIWRDAKRRTDPILSHWRETHADFYKDIGDEAFDKEFKALWECVHAEIVQCIKDTEKRLEKRWRR